MCTPPRLAGSATGLPAAGLSPASDSRGAKRASASRAAKVPTVINPAATRETRFGVMASHSGGEVNWANAIPVPRAVDGGNRFSIDVMGSHGMPSVGLRCWLLIDLFHDAAENLALPIELMHRPAVDSPARLTDDLRPAVLVDVTLTLRLGRLETAPRGPGVASPPRDLIVVHDRHDARGRQIEKTQR